MPKTNWVDIIVVIFLIRGGYVGLTQGFSVELFKTLGTTVAGVLSLVYYAQAGEFLASHSFLSSGVAESISFLVLLFALLFVFRIIRIFLFRILHLDFFGNLEMWAGFALGLARSLIFASLSLFVLTLLPVEYFKETVEVKSFSGAYVRGIAPEILNFALQFRPKVEENK